MRTLIVVLTILATVLMLVLAAGSRYGPMIRVKTPAHTAGAHLATTSLNWAGYVAATNLLHPENNTVTQVRGGWKVPAVTCGFLETSSSAHWIGLDGIEGTTVEQVGITADCTLGVAHYGAWWELYPDPSHAITIAVNPGDLIQAAVQSSDGLTFNLAMQNVTQHQTFTTAQQSVTAPGQARRNSAEWVVEGPTGVIGMLGLANFDLALRGVSYVTINGVETAIGNPSHQKAQVVMATSDGTVRANPSPLGQDGASFSVQWLHS